MSTIKFDLQDDLEELRARIYLDTHKRLTKKELLELVFRIGKQNYNDIIKELQAPNKILPKETITKIHGMIEDFGPGTETLSKRIDEICYGSKE